VPHLVPLFGFNSQKNLNKFTYPQFWLPQFDLILFNLFTQTLPKTPDKLTLSLKQLDIKLQLNLGVLEELCLVFPVFLEVELIVPVKPLLETCVAEVVCLLPPKPGEDGIVESTKDKEDMPPVQLLLPPLFPHW
jgi:hypothetical protein